MKGSEREMHHENEHPDEIVQDAGGSGPERAGSDVPHGESDPGVHAETGAESGEGSGHDETVAEERPELAELAELRDRHLRLGAEFENYRKRTREEMGATTARAKASLIGSLLDVFDDFERMHQVNAENSTAQSVLEGVALVDRKLHRVLAEAGLEIIDPTGEYFDPERMEAVVRVPTDDPDEDDLVDQVLQRGALFKGHLVRPARVAVRKVD